MAQDFSNAFYHSRQWKRARQAALQRDHYLCQDCLRRGLITPAAEVHHIIELTPDNINDPQITTAISNLICLCHDCHQRRHKQDDDRKRWRIDADGRLIL